MINSSLILSFLPTTSLQKTQVKASQSTNKQQQKESKQKLFRGSQKSGIDPHSEWKRVKQQIKKQSKQELELAGEEVRTQQQ